MIYSSQISSVLFFPPPPLTLLCSVLLWACASSFQTLLKSLSPSLSLARSFLHSDSPFSSAPFGSPWPRLFLLDFSLIITILLSSLWCLLLLFSAVLYLVLQSHVWVPFHLYNLPLLAFTESILTAYNLVTKVKASLKKFCSLKKKFGFLYYLYCFYPFYKCLYIFCMVFTSHWSTGCQRWELS